MFTLVHLTYWSCCILFGPPLSQPKLTTVLSTLNSVLFGEAWGSTLPLGPRHEGKCPTWHVRVSYAPGPLVHLLLGRPFWGMLAMADSLILSQFYNHRDQKIDRPLCVISCGRSGSTSLGQLLGSDPQL